MTALLSNCLLLSVAPPHGGRGLKYRRVAGVDYTRRSPPSWGAWIEIQRKVWERLEQHVAPLAGGVD